MCFSLPPGSALSLFAFFQNVIPAKAAALYFGAAEYPEALAPFLQTVIPANAGIQ
ncbi:MAG: hypothetical protein JF591_20470 [Lysobacter sp.]|nr:hypothetical protein [Lysobacter sp.]